MRVEGDLFEVIDAEVDIETRSAIDGKNRKYKDQNRRLSYLKGGKTNGVKA